MVTTQILAKVGAGRLKKAVEGLVTGAYAITVTIQNEEEMRGFVLNGDNHQYGVVLTEGHTFCSCPHAMYRKTVCKHAVALALHVIRTPKMQTEAEENEEPKSVNTREELGLLLRTCQEHFPAPYPLISLLSRTGLRMGEALGL